MMRVREKINDGCERVQGRMLSWAFQCLMECLSEKGLRLNPWGWQWRRDPRNEGSSGGSATPGPWGSQHTLLFTIPGAAFTSRLYFTYWDPWLIKWLWGNFQDRKEKLKLGRWTSGQEGGRILWLIWDIGIMSKIQPNPTHCPWDTCHLLCLVPKLFPLFGELFILWLGAHCHTQEAENDCGWLPHLCRTGSGTWPRLHWPNTPAPASGARECRGNDLGSAVFPGWFYCKVWGQDPSQAALNLVLSICCEFLPGPRCFKLIPFLSKSSKFNLCCLQSKIEADPALCGLLAQGHLQLK